MGSAHAFEVAMLSYTFVDAFTRVERHEAVARLKRVIAAADGVIIDFAFFSDRALRLTVELEASSVRGLAAALEACNMHLFDACATTLSRSATTMTKPVLALLHVAFVEDADLAADPTAA